MLGDPHAEEWEEPLPSSGSREDQLGKMSQQRGFLGWILKDRDKEKEKGRRFQDEWMNDLNDISTEDIVYIALYQFKKVKMCVNITTNHYWTDI